MLTTGRLRERIVKRTGYSRDVVTNVLLVATDEIRNELLQQGAVHLTGLFYITPMQRTYYSRPKKPPADLSTLLQRMAEPPRVPLQRIVLGVRPVRAFRQQLTDVLRGLSSEEEVPMMDKYGVVLDDTHQKIAMQRGQPCPNCGSRVVNYTGLTPHCPNCGTAPWEKRPDAKEEGNHRR